VVVAEVDEVKLFQVTRKSEGTTVPQHKAFSRMNSVKETANGLGEAEKNSKRIWDVSGKT